MPYLGNVPSSFNVGTNNIDNGSVTTEKIADGAVVNADVSASAAIAGTKISPDFGSQNLLTTGTATAASFIPSSSTAPTNGIYLSAANTLAISTGGSGRLFINSSGDIGMGTNALINSAGYTSLFLNGSLGGSIGFKTGDVIKQYIYSTATTLNYYGGGSDSHIFYCNTEKMRLTPTGLGVGTSSPSDTSGFGGTLDVNGTTGAACYVRTNGSATNFGLIGHYGTDLYVTNNSNGPTRFFTNGGERLRITSAGLVGIGTSTFSYLANKLVIDKGSTANDGITIVSSTTSNASIWFADGTTGSEAYRGGIDYQHSSDKLYLYAGGQGGTVIDSSGRVGIGTTAPSSLLHLEGSDGVAQIRLQRAGTNIYGIIRQTSAPYGLTYDAVDVNTGSPTHAFRTSTDGSTFSERARIDSSGRLLVGTSSASNTFTTALLQGNAADTTGDGVLRLARGAATPASGNGLGYIVFSDSGHVDAAYIFAARDGGTWSGSSKPTRLVFSTTADGASSPTERGRFTSTGYFKASNNGSYTTFGTDMHELRTTASQWTTSIRNVHASDPYGLYITYSASPNNTTNPFVHCATDTGGTFAQIRSNGGLANVQANNVNLSDERTKKDISPASDTWNCIKEWEIVNYHYKNQPDDADLNLGVIAQQVAESCPEVITVFQEAKEATEDQPAQEERLGVKEQQMYWMAIKALQEAQVRIEQLEAKVAALESA